jgi:glyoxylase-like metal-dependent hydrolase (beta-lactamase superfamily II)
MLLSRRQALMTGAAAPFATLATQVAADGHATAAAPSVHSDFTLGDFRVTTLLAGTASVETPQNIFGMNVDAETFSTFSEENFIPDDRVNFFFTPTVVNTGSEVVLFDTGQNAAGLTAALAAAGYAPDDINKVVITHMHGDHIGGLTDADGNETFKNASYTAGQVEYDHWAKADNDGFKAKVQPLAEKMTFVGEGASIASGITGVEAFGHTPGHMTYALESGDAQIMLMADTTNHHVWSLARPDWEVRFDMDKAAAAATRRKLLGMLASDRFAMIGYHMPFPGVGYVETRGDGFHYVPHSYQLL